MVNRLRESALGCRKWFYHRAYLIIEKLELTEGRSKPEVKYAQSGSVHIAYMSYGAGLVNLVVTPGSTSHLDYYWEEPGIRKLGDELAKFARVAIFDKRGTGLSDRNTAVPTFEERMDDIRAVMDAAGFDNAVLFGMSEGVPMSILFAASYPTRTRGLVLYGGEAKGTWSPDYPWESTKEQWDQYFATAESNWGTIESAKEAVAVLAPSRLNDEKFCHWMWEMRRMGASPGTGLALARSEMNMDVRTILPAIHVPTLVIHLTGDRAADIGEGRYIASHIPGARLVELDGIDHMFFVDPTLTDRIVSEIRSFAEETEPIARHNRLLTTVLFTDIVGSTRKAVELGDSKWQSLLESHNSMVENELRRFNGILVKNTGDGFLATFDGPTRAIKCAWAVTRAARDIGIEIRAGVHTGECMIGPKDVSGVAVHIASRVVNEASPGEVMVSGTVKDLVYGSGISFTDRGEYQLKGIEERRRLFAVESLGQSS
jgi:class 3 adenylate cyclase